MSLAGLIDVPTEIKRLEKQIAEKQKSRDGVTAKLANEKFVIERPARGGAAAARHARGPREADRGAGGEPEGLARAVTATRSLTLARSPGGCGFLRVVTSSPTDSLTP